MIRLCPPCANTTRITMSQNRCVLLIFMVSLWLPTVLVNGSDDKPPETPTSPAFYGVAVIDLDALAAQLGTLKAIQQVVNDKQGELESNLTTLQTAYQEELSAVLKKQGEKPSDSQKTSTRALMQELSSNVNQYRNQAQKDLVTLRQKLVDDFRNQVKPVARRIALRRGCPIVLSKHDKVLLSFEPEVDITSTVAAEMLAAIAQQNSAALQATGTSEPQPVRAAEDSSPNVTR